MRLLSKGPSPHLSWAELACHDGTPYPVEWRLNRAVRLAVEFELVRKRVGGPIRILSAYRTAERNRLVGGARNSEHVQGRALDMEPPPGMTVARLHELVLAEAAEPDSRIRGVGLYPWGVHMDVRPAERLARWVHGRPAADEVA
ncbi:YcbK family protein [Longimicrobium sp.]|uniref:YcbK family protein n=1 Tax=Longimicrobium sp. TaxID=2029185 RepID=UPI002E300A32|nr:D-Ala-D-Ala carboxypeptidase family metallohydrolase [Longimicrobium sp.]HEX6038897.1 D-Ala-D-Ala carboxypeptidase family metallohydrolase [Longimicrobium sp.]